MVSPELVTHRLPRFVWSAPGTLLLLLVVAFLVFAPMMPEIDGRIFPVTTKVSFFDVKATEGGLAARMSFVKLRNCEFLGASLDRDGQSIEFAPVSGEDPLTIAAGERVSRPWFIGSDNVLGLRLRFVHRCSPLYTTVTLVYP